MKEELLQEEKVKEERAPKGRGSRDVARDKEALREKDTSREKVGSEAAPGAGTPAHKEPAAREKAASEASGHRAPDYGRGGAGSTPAHKETAVRDKEAARDKEPPREIRDLRETKELREPRELREVKDPREDRSREPKDLREERPEKRDPRDEKEDMLRALKMLAPGTPLREGLESILRAKMGALIILDDSQEILDLVEGGFRIDTAFTPPNVYELSKMDGAIILSQDAQRILYANTQLVPDSLIPSEETGIRHRTAQRFASQTGAIVIAISHRRGVITLYKGSSRYILREIGMILSKANQAIQTLERYKRVLDKAMVNLTALEFEELVTVFDVAKVVQRGEMVMRIVRELEGYIVELGVEGRLVTMQAEELVANVEDELFYVIQDYHATSDRSVAEIKQYLSNCSSEELLELSNFSRALGYGAATGILDLAVFPRGYRILHKIPKLPTLIIENLVQTFVRLQNIVKASIEELDAVEGIGEARARAIKNGMRRLQEQVMLDRYM